jgi:hypothetical protein
MSKHTPGPWGLDAGPYQLPTVYAGHDLVPPDALLAPYKGIAEIRASGISEEEAEANARLIIAAPDFLTACLGPSQEVTALEWLSAFLTETYQYLGTVETDDRSALYLAHNESCRLLRGLQAAAAKAQGEGAQ